MKLFALALLPYLLFACSKKEGDLKSLQDRAGPVVNGPITLAVAPDAHLYWMALGLFKEAYPDRASEVEEAATAFHAKVANFVEENRAEMQKKEAASNAALLPIISRTDAIQKSVRAVPKDDRFSIRAKAGDCVATETGKEFDEVPSLFEVKITKLEKIGKENVLAKKIFEVVQGPITPDWGKDLAAQSAQEVSQQDFWGSKKINCQEGISLAALFQKTMATNFPMLTDIKNFSILAKIVR